jgi:hypothetical protein
MQTVLKRGFANVTSDINGRRGFLIVHSELGDQVWERPLSRDVMTPTSRI